MIPLGDLVTPIVARLPAPAGPRPVPPPLPPDRHPLVLAVLAAFPGAVIGRVRETRRIRP